MGKYLRVILYAVNASTLTLYLVAGLLSLSLSGLTLGFTRLQPGTLLARHWAVSILVLAVGFIAAGFGSDLPRWTTVIGTNILLLAAGVILYDGVKSFSTRNPNQFDPWNWSLLACAAVPFWYWGLVEPDGNYRSAVFSFAYALINARIATVLIRTAKRTPKNLALWTLAILFAVMTVSLAGRGFINLLSASPPISLRGNNPTHWSTVFWYVLLVASMTLCVFWMELTHLRHAQSQVTPAIRMAMSRAESSLSRIVLLWATVGVIAIGLLSELGVAYSRFVDMERTRLVERSVLTNDALTQHTTQVMNQLETTLQAVRGYHLQARSLQQTESFIASLHFDSSVIVNVSLADADGLVAVSHDPNLRGRSLADTAYYAYHRDHLDDTLFISSVEFANGTGSMQFGVSRRINRPDGRFGGLVLGTVNPEAFTRYYRQLTRESPSVAALIGTLDHKLRVRTPELPKQAWGQPLNSPVWGHLDTAPSGVFDAVSPVDGVRRTYVYKIVGALPLVMVNGFSDAELMQGTGERMQWLLLSALIVLACVVVLAALLSTELRRREEQERFMSMLSHELKTPMSVIRMGLGAEVIGPAMRQRVARAVDDMNAVVERCLQSDLLHNGRMKPNRETCHIEEILLEIQAASHQPERLGIEASALPSLQGDRQLLQVILVNLVDNALKYSEPGSVVQVQALRQARGRRPGITMQVRNVPGTAGAPDPKQVFKKYYRAPGAHGKTGSGLGLHIAAGFARRLRGDLRYLPDTKTVKFELWLPL